jgi:hypothetical protein
MTELSAFAIAPSSHGTSLQLALSRREVLARYRHGVGESDQRSARSAAAEIQIAEQSESHFETPTFVPLWDGPRLLPVFVAQILGQTMPPAICVTPQCYGRTASGRGRLVDMQS